jgi:hypothetical protein
MGDQATTTIIDTGDPVAVAAIAAIHHGDVARLRQLLADHPDLATSRLGDDRACGMSRSWLHVATDLPGPHAGAPATADNNPPPNTCSDAAAT